MIDTQIRSEQVSIESFRKKIINYSQLKVLTEELSMSLTLEDTTRILSVAVSRLLGGEDATFILYLFHSKTGELGISSSQKGQLNVNIKSKKGDIFDQWVVKTMQPLLVEDLKNDFRFDKELCVSEDARLISSLISVPLIVGHKALGILRLDSPGENYFTSEDIWLLTTVADLGAVAIENAQLYEHVEQLAIRDSLTDLYLRRHLLERLSEEIARHARRKEQLSFLMIDLDNFKQYNDRLGHTAGDIVLRTVAGILTEMFQYPGNIVCRYGGEEFCVLLPECQKQKAFELAEEARKAISEKSIFLRREETFVTVSIGVATFPLDSQDREELIYKADQALYIAKNKGRDRVVEA